MKIISVVEATTVNAVAKVTLDFFRTARELATSGNDPQVEGSVITFDRRLDKETSHEFVLATRAAGIEVDVIPERRRFDLSVIPALKTIIENRQPDLVITNSVKSHFLIWRSRLWEKYPWIAFHHGYTATDRKMRVYNRLDRWSLRKADRVITVCAAFARELSNITNIPQKQIAVQHNSIRPASPADSETVQSLRRHFGIREDERVILSIGRLSKEKAHADLIAAFLRLRATQPEIDGHLVIVGDGPERANLESAARAAEASEQIILAGEVKDVQPFYALADVFVLASHSEGSPNVLLEAMAAHVPVVATAVGGVPEIVADNESALLIPASDPAALAAAIARVLSDDDLSNHLTTRAAKLVLQNHSPVQCARTLLRYYWNTIAARKSD